jgi:hypothetical protein
VFVGTSSTSSPAARFCCKREDFHFISHMQQKGNISMINAAFALLRNFEEPRLPRSVLL